MKEVFRLVAASINNPPPPISATEELAALDLRLCRIIAPHIEQGSEGIDPAWWGIVNGDAPPQVHDAIDVLKRLRETWEDLPNCSLEEAFLFGIGIGQLVEKCSVRRFEPLVLQAKTTANQRRIGAKKGAATRSKRKETLGSKVRKFVDEQVARGGKLTRIQGMAAKKFGCSVRTIQRHCSENSNDK